MKTLISTCFAAALVLLTSTTFAAVWRLNNNPVVDADFSTLAAAISGAAVGDTIYVEGSNQNYGTMSLTKQLTIIGTGYFITENDTTQAFLSPSELTGVSISSAAAGSVLTGLQIRGSFSSTSGGLVRVMANNITIDRCYIWNTINTTTRGIVVQIDGGLDNVIIKRSFLYRNATNSCSTSPRVVVEILGNATNIVVENNIIKLGSKGTAFSGSFCDSYAIRTATTSTGVFRNNVINGEVLLYNSIFNNNIMLAGSFVPTNMIQVIHNLGNTTQFGTDNGNQSSVDMNEVFEYGPGSEDVDNHYILKAGSPAIGAGVSGIDAGIFGGDDPYYLSGLPAIPAVFEATIPTIVTTASGININTKIKAHD